MVRFLPRLYDWRMRSKVLRMYGELRFLEDELTSARGTGSRGSLMSPPLDMPIAIRANFLRFELLINLKTAKDIGHEVPKGLLLRVDQVIE